jgi:hypothetical protein
MRRTVVRYTVLPGRAEENAALVRAVYAELAEARPPGFRYATYRLDDGDTFVHVAEGEGNPLPDLAAFRAFQSGIRERCSAPPVVSAAELVGSY